MEFSLLQKCYGSVQWPLLPPPPRPPPLFAPQPSQGAGRRLLLARLGVTPDQNERRESEVLSEGRESQSRDRGRCGGPGGSGRGGGGNCGGTCPGAGRRAADHGGDRAEPRDQQQPAGVDPSWCVWGHLGLYFVYTSTLEEDEESGGLSL
uniref:Uncharacterized protein n=1 Tax=Ananas comosus var. bracteatus TaxID=296719 RepID=A0A6V7QEW9_ANACO|nr:unnamed protein product [Ananas comosus var. bracteatus]